MVLSQAPVIRSMCLLLDDKKVRIEVDDNLFFYSSLS